MHLGRGVLGCHVRHLNASYTCPKEPVAAAGPYDKDSFAACISLTLRHLPHQPLKVHPEPIQRFCKDVANCIHLLVKNTLLRLQILFSKFAPHVAIKFWSNSLG
jgi:hypothetical protein